MPNKTEETLLQFVNKLVEEKKIAEDVGPDVLEEIKNDLFERIEDRINAMILEKIPPHKLEEFEEKLGSDSDSDLQSFCEENIPNLDQEIASELLAFRQTYLGL